MVKFGNTRKPLYLLLVSLVVGSIAACGGDDASIFGSESGTAGPGPAGAAPNLGASVGMGSFSGGGTAGMTNQGTLTQINGGDVSTTATASSAITGLHDSAGDIYTETAQNIGAVSGKIFTCTVSTTGPTSAAVNAASCNIANNALAAAQAAFNDLSPASRPGGQSAAGNLSGLTLAPGIYTAPAGGFLIQNGTTNPAGDLTLDAQGNANAVWVFQTPTTLTVGGPGAAFPRSVNLTNGAQAKNVFWRVGSAATINAGGGGTMVGTIISSAATSVSTAGAAAITTLNGRAMALNASVTIVNTVINIPAP